MTATANTTSNSTQLAGSCQGGVTAQLRRLRWAVRSTLALGVAASVAANVLHARPNPISQIIAAWPPLALLLTVELISRVPHHRRLLGAIRIAATAVIAGIATWVSYWHLAGVAARYGETEHVAAYLLPISVDGLVIVASVSLVELTARIHAAPAPCPVDPPPAAADATAAPSSASSAPPISGTPDSAELATSQPLGLGAPDNIGAGHPAAGTGRRLRAERNAMAPAPTRTAYSAAAPEPVGTTAAPAPRPRRHEHADARESPSDQNVMKQTFAPSMPSEPAMPFRSHDGHSKDDAAQVASPPANRGRNTVGPMDGAGDTPAEDVLTDTAAAVAYWRRRDPDLHPADIATRIGRSERTVRRYLSQPATNGTVHVNRRPAGSRLH